MATHLQQLLQSLCWNTEWNYAVFWKLKHRARMVLTWEDAFYNNQIKVDPSVSKSFGEALESLHDDHVANDPLGMAVAKMSYHVYSLGEGIVGQVAVTGKHRWIFAGEQTVTSCSPLELCDGWQAQFAAGIKTIVVAAVVPYGVVQLGSLNKVNENLQLLTHIRYVFSSLQESACHIQTPIQSSLQNVLQMSDIPARNFTPDALQECLLDLGKTINKENTSSSSLDFQPPKIQFADSFGAPFHGVHLSDAAELMKKNKFVQSVSESQQSTDLLHGTNCGSNSYKIQNGVTSSGQKICASSKSCLTDNSTIYDVKLYPSEGKVQKVVASDSLGKQKVENKIKNQPEFSCLDALGNLTSSVMYSAGTELHEALGPGFLKQCYPWSWESENPEERPASQMPEAMESSLLTTDSGTDHLLEAVVANFCRNDATFKSAKSLSTSESMLTTEKMPEPSINTSHTIGSSSYYSIGCSSLLEESTQNCSNSPESGSIRSSTSSYREPLARTIEPGKGNKKRARPGESSRPRPRDRQLIQDRIKELRDLVPNGSKCSIDSLLERTIKHMVFMQSVTKHADKLSNCVKSRGCSNEMGVLGSGYEQGSSWAVEVGGHMKICPILVENLNMNGQMLIEMLCEDCDHFLEIAEAIRSVGLTILKGMTDNHADKTWMRFVVESQSNRNLHRMDVLWSLVQLLQSKSTL
ncbi:transcription factor EMB1444 [Beta vulgaris subsp. vulgaris]|uniref:transcription factor EMB1444 n=1 Tax=Beta vulgaris subsp. vulgaris TaxID=3555 RepID=UPI002036AA9A|nr:transcription factor EMB1444 [Beta vulgaris subsp. vulgaris]